MRMATGARVASVTWAPAADGTSGEVLRLLGEVLFGHSGAAAVPSSAPPSEPAEENPRAASASGA
jgi:hypothetical protein